MKLKSIRTKILLFSTVLLLTITSSIIVFSLIASRQAIGNQAVQKATAFAVSYANEIKAELDRNVVISETYASCLVSNHDTNGSKTTRSDIISQTKNILNDAKKALGIYVIFEPNAFDNNDEQYKNIPGNEKNGRFNMYWARDEFNNLILESDPDTNIDVPGDGDYYYLVKKNQSAQIIDPYFYPVAGKDVLMSSFSVPILKNGRFIGIVGIDISLDYFQKNILTLNKKDSIYKLSIISNNGTIVASQLSTKYIGKNIDSIYNSSRIIKNYYQNNKIFSEIINDTMNIIVPFYISSMNLPWAVSVRIPQEKIYFESTKLTYSQILISIIISIIGLIAIFIFSKKFSQPIVYITEIAKRLSKGDLSILSNVKSNDELHELSESFNLLINTINSLIKEIKETHQEIHNGNLKYEADSSGFLGTYKEVIEQINLTLGAIVTPLRKSTEYFNLISRGEIPDIIEEEFLGDYEIIRISLNRCILSINSLVGSIKNANIHIQSGDLNFQIIDDELEGDFRAIVNGINLILNRFVNLFNQIPISIQITDISNNIIFENKQINKYHNNLE